MKFDTDALPPILNALETENDGQKLVLEVAVCYLLRRHSVRRIPANVIASNIWVKMLSERLLWMVGALATSAVLSDETLT